MTSSISLPFFIVFYLTKPLGRNRYNMLQGKELQTKKISANNISKIPYSLKEHKFWFYIQLRLTDALGFAIIRSHKWSHPLSLWHGDTILFLNNQLKYVKVFFFYYLYATTHNAIQIRIDLMSRREHLILWRVSHTSK